MLKMTLIILIILVLIGGVFYLGKTRDSSKSGSLEADMPSSTPAVSMVPTVQPTPSPTPGLTEGDIKSIKDKLQNSNNPSNEKLIITINEDSSKYNGLFAKGMVSPEGGGGGGIWVAAKSSGEWKIVFEGNGIASCEEIAPYNVPAELLDNCADKMGNVIDR